MQNIKDYVKLKFKLFKGEDRYVYKKKARGGLKIFYLMI